jgi:hypothetical protein
LSKTAARIIERERVIPAAKLISEFTFYVPFTEKHDSEQLIEQNSQLRIFADNIAKDIFNRIVVHLITNGKGYDEK